MKKLEATLSVLTKGGPRECVTMRSDSLGFLFDKACGYLRVHPVADLNFYTLTIDGVPFKSALVGDSIRWGAAWEACPPRVDPEPKPAAVAGPTVDELLAQPEADGCGNLPEPGNTFTFTIEEI